MYTPLQCTHNWKTRKKLVYCNNSDSAKQFTAPYDIQLHSNHSTLPASTTLEGTEFHTETTITTKDLFLNSDRYSGKASLNLWHLVPTSRATSNHDSKPRLTSEWISYKPSPDQSYAICHGVQACAAESINIIYPWHQKNSLVRRVCNDFSIRTSRMYLTFQTQLP